MAGFFRELKRHEVCRVTLAYVIAAAGIIQLTSAIFPAWEVLPLITAFGRAPQPAGKAREPRFQQLLICRPRSA